MGDMSGHEAGEVEPEAVRPVDLRDYVAFDPDRAAAVRVFATERLAVDLWCLEPRQSTPVLHHPDKDTAYTVVGGRSWFVTDAGEVGLDPMGALLVRAGTVHGIDNRAADPLIVIAMSSPPSETAEADPVELLGEAVHAPGARAGPLRRALDSVLGGGHDTSGRPDSGR